MGNLAITYQHIADILSFETSNEKLGKELNYPSFDWDSIVIEGSRHLVLPAIYCRLKSKQLLHVLPEELKNYLKEITSLNRKRNEAILNQVYSISQLLNKHKIDHVFLKGSALLVTDCFEDNAERMIADIDILITLNQLDESYILLKNNGYKPIEQTLGNNFIEHKHLPRLKPEHEICAIELHRKLFVSYEYPQLSSLSLINEKVKSANIFIPSQKHLLMHNILNFQINDKGALYKSISFRSAYDIISLQKDYNYDTIWNQNKHFINYFKHASIFFKDLKSNTLADSNYSKSFYLFKLKHIKFYKFWNKTITLISLTPVLFRRMLLFLSNKSYRKAVVNDRIRIYKHFKSILSNN